MEDVLIAELSEDRLEETIEVAVRAFGSETARENAEIDFPASIKDFPRPHKTLIALQNDKVIGATQCMHGNLSVDIYNVLWVCVDPNHQGKGVGKAITKKACEYIENNFLKGRSGTIVLAADIDTSFYEKLGFENKTNTHSDGVIMRKIIKEK
jgi:ribosomal protein S18 acetylase RimI-like enzyme